MRLHLRTRPQRATAGAIVLVLLLALTYLGTRAALGAFSPDYRVAVNVGQLGQGIVTGSDVKMRGVLVGEVGEISLNDDLEALVELILEPQYQVPQRATFDVSAKTLLGEKQIDVLFDGPVDEGPFEEQGAMIDSPARVVEFQDVLAELNELFEAIDPEDLAVLIDDGIGAFDGQGEVIAAAVDEGARAVDLSSSLLEDQVPATRDLALVAETLGSEGAAFNRLASETTAGLPTLTDNQVELRGLLDDLVAFADVLDATLTVDRANLDRLIISGDSVTRMLFAYQPEVGELIQGLHSYTFKFPEGFRHPAIDGQAAGFLIFIREEGLEGTLCDTLPAPLTQDMPMCADRPDGAGLLPPPPDGLPDLPLPDLPLPGVPGAAAPHAPLFTLPLPDGFLTPDVPQRNGIDSLLEATLRGL